MPQRLKAFTVHLLASILIVGPFILFTLLSWYPPAYTEAMEIWSVLRIIILVGLIIGPLLTLIIASPTKPRAELIRDISLIIVLQIVAFGWGSTTAYQSRPLYTVFYKDHFFVANLNAYQNLGQMDEQLKPAFWRGPQVVTVDLTNNYSIFRTDLYAPLSAHASEIANKGLSLEKQSGLPTSIRTLVQQNNIPMNDNFRAYPCYVMNKKCTLIYDIQSNLIKKILPTPFPESLPTKKTDTSPHVSTAASDHQHKVVHTG